MFFYLKVKVDGLCDNINQKLLLCHVKITFIIFTQESEEKYKADRKKWLEEKGILTSQAKEAENLRNREMKKYAEDRERCLKLQSEVVSSNGS